MLRLFLSAPQYHLLSLPNQTQTALTVSPFTVSSFDRAAPSYRTYEMININNFVVPKKGEAGLRTVGRSMTTTSATDPESQIGHPPPPHYLRFKHQLFYRASGATPVSRRLPCFVQIKLKQLPFTQANLTLPSSYSTPSCFVLFFLGGGGGRAGVFLTTPSPNRSSTASWGDTRISAWLEVARRVASLAPCSCAMPFASAGKV